MFLKAFLLITATVATTMNMSSHARADEPQVAHLVFYTLTEDTPDNRRAMLSQIKKYLTGHNGVVYFSAGEIAGDMDRSVNDRDFQISMNIVFVNRKAHDAYNVHPRHEAFKTKNKPMIKKVRVFDTYLTRMDHATE